MESAIALLYSQSFTMQKKLPALTASAVGYIDKRVAGGKNIVVLYFSDALWNRNTGKRGAARKGIKSDCRNADGQNYRL